MVVAFEVLLRALCEAPTRPVSSLALLTEPERRMLCDWNATGMDYPRDASIHRLFVEQVKRTPAAPAISSGEPRLSYAELDRRSSQLAARLVAAGVGREARVGLYLERSAESYSRCRPCRKMRPHYNRSEVSLVGYDNDTK